MIVVWDEPKRASNLRVHGIDFADIREAFDVTAADVVVSYGGRIAATGFLGDRLITVVFGVLGSDAISLISARLASR